MNLLIINLLILYTVSCAYVVKCNEEDQFNPLDPLAIGNVENSKEEVSVKEKRCPRVAAQSPNTISPIVGATQPNYKTLCTTCQNRPPCKVLKKCDSCKKWCEPEAVTSSSAFEDLGYPIASVDNAIVKAAAINLFGIEDANDVDKLTCWATTRSKKEPKVNLGMLNSPQEVLQLVKKQIKQNLIERIKEGEVNCLSTEDVEKILDDMLIKVNENDQNLATSRSSFSGVVIPQTVNPAVIEDTLKNPSLRMENPESTLVDQNSQLRNSMDNLQAEDPIVEQHEDNPERQPIVAENQLATTEKVKDQSSVPIKEDLKTRTKKLLDKIRLGQKPKPFSLKAISDADDDNIEGMSEPESADILIGNQKATSAESKSVESKEHKASIQLASKEGASQTTEGVFKELIEEITEKPFQTQNPLIGTHQSLEPLKPTKHEDYYRSSFRSVENEEPVDDDSTIDAREPAENDKESLKDISEIIMEPVPNGQIIGVQEPTKNPMNKPQEPIEQINRNDQTIGAQEPAESVTEEAEDSLKARTHKLIKTLKEKLENRQPGYYRSNDKEPLKETIMEPVPNGQIIGVQEPTKNPINKPQEPIEQINRNDETIGAQEPAESVTEEAEDSPKARTHKLIKTLKEKLENRQPGYYRSNDKEPLKETIMEPVPNGPIIGVQEPTENPINKPQQPIEQINRNDQIIGSQEPAESVTEVEDSPKARTHKLIKTLKEKLENRQPAYYRSNDKEPLKETIMEPVPNGPIIGVQEPTENPINKPQEPIEQINRNDQIIGAQEPAESVTEEVEDSPKARTHKLIKTLKEKLENRQPAYYRSNDKEPLKETIMEPVPNGPIIGVQEPTENPINKPQKPIEQINRNDQIIGAQEPAESVTEEVEDSPKARTHKLIKTLKEKLENRQPAYYRSSNQEPSKDTNETKMKPINGVQELTEKAINNHQEPPEHVVNNNDQTIGAQEPITEAPIESSKMRRPVLLDNADQVIGAQEPTEKTQIVTDESPNPNSQNILEDIKEQLEDQAATEDGTTPNGSAKARTHKLIEKIREKVGKINKQPSYYRLSESGEDNVGMEANQGEFGNPTNIKNQEPTEEIVAKTEDTPLNPNARTHKLKLKEKLKKTNQHPNKHRTSEADDKQRVVEEASNLDANNFKPTQNINDESNVGLQEPTTNLPEAFKTRTHKLLERINAMNLKPNEQSTNEEPKEELRSEPIKPDVLVEGRTEIPDGITPTQYNEVPTQLSPRLNDEVEDILKKVENLTEDLERTLQLTEPTSASEVLGSQPLEDSFERYAHPYSQNKYQQVVGSAMESNPKEMYFIGNGIKLPLQLVKNEDGAMHLAVDVDKLCSCNNLTCTKNDSVLEAILDHGENLDVPLGMPAPNLQSRFNNEELQEENSGIMKRSPDVTTTVRNNEIPKTFITYRTPETPTTTTNYFRDYFTKKISEIRSKFDPKPADNKFQTWLRGLTSKEDQTSVLRPFSKVTKEDLTLGQRMKNIFQSSEETKAERMEKELEEKLKQINNSIDKYYKKNEEIIRKESGNAEGAILREEIGIMGNFLRWLKDVVNANRNK